MSEEVTYATLSFQESVGAGNNQNRNNLRKKGKDSGKVRLDLGGWTGVQGFETSKEIDSDSENLSQLQKTVHHQQDNLSQQLSNYRNFPTEEELLKSQISNLLKKQGQMAIKLCQELVIHTSDHKCNPCPKMWHWHQNSCYYFAMNEEKTWSNSRKNCMDKNSTLVKIDSLEEKGGKVAAVPKANFQEACGAVKIVLAAPVHQCLAHSQETGPAGLLREGVAAARLVGHQDRSVS
ncbi:C-type lectin domain family 12 member B [Myotis brandtii]|uniref:C-type lectin domain family 12 member B n=1 Tax=Myotis brandtii TaxID=109478 RepID=S7N1K4_MYOBR|nr:C-type lectin domain family 12 member B [Myotis brandtii]